MSHVISRAQPTLQDDVRNGLQLLHDKLLAVIKAPKNSEEGEAALEELQWHTNQMEDEHLRRSRIIAAFAI
ncbi:hypothetical protein SNK05_001085 [Fusarium graminearum]|nr:unnamed protein product [Fusarium graminearum]CAF3600627.1 unnamed protein product [Fusarium graminearum]CAG1962633.1 unnamed protein product [Fusarium graminearum]